MKKLLLLTFLPVLFFTTCKKYQPAPSAFFIKPVSLNVAPTSQQGSASHKITDLFLYVNGKFQGAYAYGSTMPIVNYGESVRIDIFAGIKNNGISGTTITWTFYDKISFDTLVESGKTIERGLTFKYNPGVNFLWLEDFDGAGISLVRSSPTSLTTSLNIVSSAESFQGKSAMFELPSNIILGQFESSIAYTIPLGNPNVYLELNYKCDLELEVGITDGVNLKNAITLNAKSEWNKIYIQLAEAANRLPAPTQQKIYFRALNPNQMNNARVWLDNIKLITF